ncbi:TPA: aminotransferase class I/II-fold pyridoxal phosphate-dependent enzyme, partial [archaeon]|nr:aminotransferase class I/II-fold pyridoxal phosphate-dependent enzyme [Candidatus Naiadarchaeales archaeon SRR2090153.bin1042]
GKHWPAYTFAPENTLSVFTYSKSCSAPAFRLGYIYGPQKAIEAIAKLSQYVNLCPSNISQIGAEAFYKVKKQYLQKTVLPTYRKRMEVMGKMLKKHLPDAGFVKPHGAFYYFVDFSLYLRDLKLNEEKFSEKLLKEKHVVVIPGRYFGQSGRRHCRLTFVSEKESRIKEGIQRIAEFVKRK